MIVIAQCLWWFLDSLVESITTGNFKCDHFGWIIAWQEGFLHWSPHHVNHWRWQLWTPQIPYISMHCRKRWESGACRHDDEQIWPEHCTESLHNYPCTYFYLPVDWKCRSTTYTFSLGVSWVHDGRFRMCLMWLLFWLLINEQAKSSLFFQIVKISTAVH